MSNLAIEIRGLSKKYVLAHMERYSALRDRLTFAYLMHLLRSEPQTREEFWALQNVSFDVKAGETVGIIGRNGAGKSTLLKLLSRITAPTSGEARIHGRVGSLLEVGTGFHPELTGRENIYINGALLGMQREEISRQFDAIAAFAEVEKFLDTPVKRYSSGMYVRLAFAVAAHLEPEILIVDEVLAVGDAQFQKKCLGKMEDASRNSGRTILFVSHNMTAVRTLCRRAIWLHHGKVMLDGETSQVIAAYLERQVEKSRSIRQWEDDKDAPGNDTVRWHSVGVRSVDGEEITVESAIRFQAEFTLSEEGTFNLTLFLRTTAGEVIFASGGARGRYSVGRHRVICEIPGKFLNDGSYTFDVLLVRNGNHVAHEMREVIDMQVTDVQDEWFGKWPGAVRPLFFTWRSQSIDASEERVDAALSANGAE